METGRILSANMPYDSPLDESKPLGYAVAFLYSLVIALFWIPAFLVRRLSRVLSEIGVDSWPRANGSITGSNVKVVHGWVADYALGRLDYSYRVAGEYYAGCITRLYPDEQAAWDFVDARQNKAVVVRYEGRPRSIVRPARRRSGSVLERRLRARLALNGLESLAR